MRNFTDQTLNLLQVIYSPVRVAGGRDGEIGGFVLIGMPGIRATCVIMTDSLVSMMDHSTVVTREGMSVYNKRLINIIILFVISY